MVKPILLALLLSLTQAISTVHQAAQHNLQPALFKLNAIWPVPSVPRSDISSTFGPRIYRNPPRNDFHRGIDISAAEGTPIVAALRGRLYSTVEFTGGGNTVILDHDVNILFHGEKRTTLTTFYMHMLEYDASVLNKPRGTIIEKGTIIGKVGHTGSAGTDHLHFEARLGSRCSQSSTCGKEFDPHVHPLSLFRRPAHPTDGVSVLVTQDLTRLQDGIIRVRTTDEFPIANRFTLVRQKLGACPVVLDVLDFTTREGYNSSSTDALDFKDTSKPYIEPYSFGTVATEWKADYVVPAGWGTKRRGDVWVVVQHDVFGRRRAVQISGTGSSWRDG